MTELIKIKSVNHYEIMLKFKQAVFDIFSVTLTLTLPAYHCRQWKSCRIYAPHG